MVLLDAICQCTLNSAAMRLGAPEAKLQSAGGACYGMGTEWTTMGRPVLSVTTNTW